MSNHLVEVPEGGWGSWEESVKRSRVFFTDEQLRLGEELVAQTAFPEKNRVLKVHDYFGVSSVTTLLTAMFKDNLVEPVHPLFLLALASGIEGAFDSSIFDHMQYRMATSPYLLSNERKDDYIFVLRNNGQTFSGEFKSLAKGDQLPRCTHIWGYKKEPDHKAPFHTFRLREDGTYGPFVR